MTQSDVSKLESKSNSGQEARIKPRKATVIGVFSCKGGVGKTTTITNLGVALSEIVDGKVLAVDANLTAPNLGIHLGELEPKDTIHDVLDGEISIEESIHQYEDLDVIFGSVAFGEEVHLVDLKSHLDPLKKKYKVILLDSAPGLGREVISAMKTCDELLIVTGPEVPTVASTLKTFHTAEQYKISIAGTIVNKITGADFELPTQDIKKSLGWPIVAEVPEDKRVREATAEGTPIVDYKPRTKPAQEFERRSIRGLEEVVSKEEND